MGSKKKTHEEFVSELKDINGDIEVIGKYIGATKKLTVRCKLHDCEYDSFPSNLLRGKGCRMCGASKIVNSKKYSFDHIQNAFIDRGIELLSTNEEISDLSVDRLRYVCPKHGEQTVLWGNFNKGAGCRKCADELNSLNMRKETWEKINSYFQNSEYSLLSSFDEYTGAKDSCLRCVCEKHGEFNISWNNLNKFEGCPICSASTGERKVFHFLKEHGIQFEHPYRFDDLIGTGGKKLSYDFFIPSKNMLIEYQGQQHDRPSQFHNIDIDTAEKNFVKQLEHDRRKREYAKNNGYQLLEIWYYDFSNVDNILNDSLMI